MGCDRRIIHANHLLAILLLVLSTMFAYADRDTFLQEKLRNRISSPLLRKWRDNSIEGAEEETNSNGEWKEELLSNLRDLLRQHHITAASPSSLRQRLSTDISAYGDDPIPQLPVDQLFVLDDGPTSSRDSSSSSSSSSSLLSPSYGGGLNGPEKRNGFFFGKRNGFFFGKRSGMSSVAASTKMDDEDRQFMQPFDGTALDECRPCGPGGKGQCVMVGTCCSPQFGCYTLTSEAAACMAEDLAPCRLAQAPICGRGGQCVANGLCCSPAEGSCHLEPACTSLFLKK